MTDEAGFLRAIQDNPEDDAARLVYADWLEERGDSRGEYLRLEHQLEPIFLRLAQLRQTIDSAWLAAASKRRKVVLVSFPPDRKITVIKLVREVSGLGLREVVDVVESSRGVIKTDLNLDEAYGLARRFQGIAEVSVEPAAGG